MLRNFQHSPGAEARSFIASREDGLDRTCPDLELAAIGSRDTSGQGQALVGQGSSQSRRGVTGPTLHAGTLSRMGVMPGGPLVGMVDPWNGPQSPKHNARSAASIAAVVRNPPAEL